MNAAQHKCFQDRKHCDVYNWREPALDAMFSKISTIVMLHHSLNDGDCRIPQCDNIQWNALVYGRRTMKLMVAIHAQTFVMMLNQVIKELYMKYNH